MAENFGVGCVTEKLVSLICVTENLVCTFAQIGMLIFSLVHTSVVVPLEMQSYVIACASSMVYFIAR